MDIVTKDPPSENTKDSNSKLVNLLQYKEKMEKCILALLSISNSKDLTEGSIIQVIINEVVELTSSNCGYLHLYNKKEQTIDLKVWSDNTLKHCTAVYDGHYPLESAGIWADCVRLKRTVIHNDYDSTPDKKGLPEGHFKLIRHMSVPVLENDDVVVIVGVGNKDTDYDAFDVQQVELISQNLWRIIKNRRYEIEIERMNEEAKYDHLTGVLIRKEFELLLEESLTASLLVTHSLANKLSNVLAFIDLDNFKVVNDTCGHGSGDDLLKKVVSTIKNRIRKTDVLGRLGGDEFGVIFHNCSLNDCEIIGNGIIADLNSENFFCKNNHFQVRVSIGLAEICNSLDDVLTNADSACYIAKKSGKNQVKIYASSDIEITGIKKQGIIAATIPDFIKNNKLKLYAQPIMYLNSKGYLSANGLLDLPLIKSCSTYEILLRVEDDFGNINLPANFLSAAIRYSLSSIVDRWVVEKTIELHNRIIESGNNRLLFFINLSIQSICDPDFLVFVEKCLKTTDHANRFCFEITENVAINNYDNAINMINRLMGIGCLFALDDFGSGFSSFGYIKKLPVNFIKIDGMFIKDICDDAFSQVIVRAINDIAHSLNILTIGEFVEDYQVLNKINELGVNFAQGYYCQRPMDVNDIFKL